MVPLYKSHQTGTRNGCILWHDMRGKLYHSIQTNQTSFTSRPVRADTKELSLVVSALAYARPHMSFLSPKYAKFTY